MVHVVPTVPLVDPLGEAWAISDTLGLIFFLEKCQKHCKEFHGPPCKRFCEPNIVNVRLIWLMSFLSDLQIETFNHHGKIATPTPPALQFANCDFELDAY